MLLIPRTTFAYPLSPQKVPLCIDTRNVTTKKKEEDIHHSRTEKMDSRREYEMMIPGVSKDPIGSICCRINAPSNNTDLMINILSTSIIFKDTRSSKINKRLGDGHTASNRPTPEFEDPFSLSLSSLLSFLFSL